MSHERSWRLKHPKTHRDSTDRDTPLVTDKRSPLLNSTTEAFRLNTVKWANRWTLIAWSSIKAKATHDQETELDTAFRSSNQKAKKRSLERVSSWRPGLQMVPLHGYNSYILNRWLLPSIPFHSLTLTWSLMWSSILPGNGYREVPFRDECSVVSYFLQLDELGLSVLAVTNCKHKLTKTESKLSKT